MNLPPSFSAPPLYRTCPTHAVPLELYQRLYGRDRFGFLYESLEAHGDRGRYSFLGGKPVLIFKSYGRRIDIESRTGGDVRRTQTTGQPIDQLRSLVRARCNAPAVATFSGGAVGYLGYDMVRFFEPAASGGAMPTAAVTSVGQRATPLAAVGMPRTDDLGHPDSYFLFPEEIIVLDHLQNRAHIILYQTNADRQVGLVRGRAEQIIAALSESKSEAGGRRTEDEMTEESVLDSLLTPSVLRSPTSVLRPPSALSGMTANMTQTRFEQSVDRAQEYILAGDIFQVVLSQRFSFDIETSPIDLYRSLRITNPSPYMYFLNLDGLQVLGSSPEVLVKLTGRAVTTKPLAGTRPRGQTPEHDEALARELIADAKERAEHIMLVDLARNDIGRVCEFGSVRVTQALGIERFSKVMHLVSNVEGTLRADLDAFDLIATAFPAGTVSGAPKIRAMQIIDELEPTRRGIYAGAIGYFSATGDMDVCIGIRTIVVDGSKGYIQAGAGIVAESQPSREYQETLTKAAGLMRAVQLARHSRSPSTA